MRGSYQMKRRKCFETWHKAIRKWWHRLKSSKIVLYMKEEIAHEKMMETPIWVRWADPGDVQIVVTRTSDNLDCIDERVLYAELIRYHLTGFPVREAPLDKEKEVVRPLWVIEVFQNGRLARQITYYLQPRYPDKTTDETEGTEASSPSKNE